MLIVVVPHFISALVRTYGWIILLGDKGLVNESLACGCPERRSSFSTTRSAWSSAPPR